MIIIPDVHGRTFWKEAVAGREKEEIVFLGDYVDPYSDWEDVRPVDGLIALLEVIDFKKQHPENVTLLLGNHDLSYILHGMGHCRYDYEHANIIKETFLRNLKLFCIAHGTRANDHNILFSHAGVHRYWMSESLLVTGYGVICIANLLNEAFWKGKLNKSLCQVSRWRGGYDEEGSCVWADVHEHLNAQYPLPHHYQIFGHTQQISDPVITDRFACLDCRKAFTLNLDTFDPSKAAECIVPLSSSIES